MNQMYFWPSDSILKDDNLNDNNNNAVQINDEFEDEYDESSASDLSGICDPSPVRKISVPMMERTSFQQQQQPPRNSFHVSNKTHRQTQSSCFPLPSIPFQKAPTMPESPTSSQLLTAAPLLEHVGSHTSAPPRIQHEESGTGENSIDAPIRQLMDRIEDEVEETYEDLVPMELKLALEDKVFGWTHLWTDFLGHAFFTVGSYVLVFQICTYAFLFMSDTSAADIATFALTWWQQAIRITLSLWALIGTYRMVRRRKMVWFRAPYGSKKYKEDQARRYQSVVETDRTTKVGRLLRHFRHKRILKRLRKAETQFAHKQRQIQQRQRLQEQQQLLKEGKPAPPSNSSTKLLLSRGTSNVSNPGSDFSYGSCSSSSSDEEDELNQSCESVVNSPATTAPSTPSSCDSRKGLMNRQRRPSFHTQPTCRMESVAHDQILFPTHTKMPYAHGGFFGAAPFLLANPHWISILRHLMPDVYVEISRRVAYSPPSKLIHWAENNPVVAAYGAAHELEYADSHIPNIEWDVFLDPKLVRRVQVVIDEREKFLASPENDDLSSEKVQQILAFYEQELKVRSEALVDKMLIAHGNLTQISLEITGYAKHYNYSRVKRTRRTLGGGIYARQWMAVFAEALKLGVCYKGSGNENDDSSLGNNSIVSGISPKILEDEYAHPTMHNLMAWTEAKCPESTMARSIEIVESITKSKKPVGLVLDIKSWHVPKHIWSIVVDTLRLAGVRVEGIASFSIEEIRNVSQGCQRPVQELIFCHSAGDLQKACHEGRIQRGDKVFFNAGCLLSSDAHGLTTTQSLLRSFDPQEVKKSYRIQPFGLPMAEAENMLMKQSNTTTWDCSGQQQATLSSSFVSCIELYKKQYNLSIGVYVQEFAIDEAAVTILAEFVNRHLHIYDLGFSWGGVNGITIQGICPERFTKTDGLWNQRLVAEDWDYSLTPMTAPPQSLQQPCSSSLEPPSSSYPPLLPSLS